MMSPPPGNEEDRETALQRLSALKESGESRLDLHGLALTSLPPLPDWITELDVGGNSLSALPDNLPATLKNLTAGLNELTSLPDRLPAGLETLDVSYNELTIMPEILPDGLKRLDVAFNRLTHLPERLPAGLKKLNVSVNQLTTLPETLPSGLEVLNVEYNQLTTFPECIVSELHATIRADGNHLSERAIQRLQELMSADDYEGSRVMFSMGRPSTTRTIQPLHQAVRNWLPLHEAEKWRAFETKTNAEVFSAFLDYLLKTQNAKNPDVMAEVSALLMRLGDDDALREKAFAITIEATEKCEDRVTYTYHNIQCALQVYDIEKGDFDSRLSELIPLGREVFRLQQIEQIAQEKVKRMHLVDPIEVFLEYQNYLRDVFELKTVIKEMRFFSVSGITRADLQQAEERIKKAESASFRQWFARWDPWHKVRERIVPEVWNDIKERRADILESDEYKQRLREVVKSLKESGVQDVELSAQMGVFEEMDNRLPKSVTEKVLAEKGLEQLLNTPWKGKLEQ